jgi:drug/metabolite transporter (DMT)-like permease
VIDHFGDNIYSLRFSMTQFAVCTVLNWILALFTEDISFAAITLAAIPIAYCGFMSVGVAYTCQVLGQKYSEPTSASIILSTESVFAAIGGALILDEHERMDAVAYVGCALILMGIVLTQIKFKEKTA